MPTRNLVLTDHQADFVERLVASGRYQNASEVLRDAARVGIADIDGGRFHSFESPAALNRHLASLADQTITRNASGTQVK